MIIDVEIADPGWGDVKQVVLSAARAALAEIDPKPKNSEVGIRLSDDKEMRQLNKDYRGHDKSTNVLSFEAKTPDLSWSTDHPHPLGDIILAYGTVQGEAEVQGKSLENHLSHLIVHGMLHLCGYDHENEFAAREMETLEARILAGLGIDDPYLA